MLFGVVVMTQRERQTHRIDDRYCLPTDTNRPLLEADRKFFDEYGNGKGQ
jgi:hypothetical protein